MPRLILILLFIPFSSFGQNYFRNHFGATAGVVLKFGTHVNGIGINLKGYYTDHFFQLNGTTTFNFYDKSYGNRKRFWESRTSFGAILLAGKKEMVPDFQLDGLNHQTSYNYGVGYNYVLYFDNAKTSQFSGGFVAHIKNLGIYFENDVFAGLRKDRFRTGHFQLVWREEFFKAGIGFNMWTGETAGARTEITHGTAHGFKILEDLPYGRTSHGILYGSFTHRLGFGQDVFMKVGIDSEHIRNTIQNKLVHDAPLLPKKMRGSTPHYPMLDQNGCPAFDKNDVRKNRLFLQFGMNENWSN